MSQFEDLKQLSEMLEQGRITQEEFNRLKASLLAEQPVVAPPVAPAPSPSEPTSQIQGQTRWWLIGTGVLMAVGSVLPWAQAGIFSFAGTEGDGIITLIGGVIVTLVGIANRVSFGAGIGTVVVAGVSLWIVATVYNNFASDDVGSIGSGLYLTGIASLAAGIEGLELIGQARKRRTQAALEAKVRGQVEEALATPEPDPNSPPPPDPTKPNSE